MTNVANSHINEAVTQILRSGILQGKRGDRFKSRRASFPGHREPISGSLVASLAIVLA